MGDAPLTTQQKALALNLDPATYGVFAEIGGGQEVARWFFSVGADYQWTDRLAVRGGIGYEISPISDSVRIPLLPDNDRTWLSVGATYKISKDLSFDLAYSHVFVKSTPINISAASGNPWFDGITYIGNVSSHIDILSLGVKYRWM